MRIAVAAHTDGRAGGVETYLEAVLPALVRRGHAVACFFEAVNGSDSRVTPPSMPVWSAGREPLPAIQSLTRWAPDVVYAHGMRSPALERHVLGLAPSVFFAHSYYGTCVSGAKSYRVPQDRACTRVFGPACLAQYYPRRCGGWSPATMLRQYRLQRDRHDTLAGCGRIVVASRHMLAEYARHGFADKLRLVPLPVVPGADRPAGLCTDRTIQLLYLGRLERTKGVDLLIPAALLAARALGRPVHLQISGKGTLAAALADDAARSYPRLTVTVTGWLSRDGCTEARARADLLLLPSRWPEPFGLSGLEAAAGGVPAVAFDAGGMREWLTDGVNGVLVPTDPPSARAFAEAIVDCLRDAPRFAQMQQRARDVAARFRMADHLAALEGVFEEVTSAERRAPSPEER
jgi:glycosyltransferase involved in cell wall biosynthesis